MKRNDCQSSDHLQPDKFSCLDLDGGIGDERVATAEDSESSVMYYIVFTKANKSMKSIKNSDEKDVKDAKDVKDVKDVKKKSKKKKKKDNAKDVDTSNDVYFQGFVSIGSLIDVGITENLKKLPTDMQVNIYQQGNALGDAPISAVGTGDVETSTTNLDSMVLVQSLTFHSSCSKNLYLGDQFGSIKLVGFRYFDGTQDNCVLF